MIEGRTGKLIGYLLIPFTGLLSPLLALPAITSQIGAGAWAALAVGQSIGMAASAVGELGWGLNGPQRVAKMAPSNAYQTLILSLRSKLVANVLLAVVVGSVAYAISPSFPAESAVVAVASLTASLSAVWFYLGRSRPWMAIATDGLPRLIGVLIGAILVLAGASLMIYAIVGLLVPCAVSPLLGLYVARRAGGRGHRRRYRLRQVLVAVTAQSSAFTARLVSALYIALPVTLVTLVAPAAVHIFAAGERLMRLLLGAMSAVPNGMQGWVGSAVDKHARWGRVRRAVFLNLAMGLIAACGFGLLGPWLSSLVFSGTSTITSGMAWVLGCVIVVVSVSRATGNLALVALSRVSVIMWSAVAGAAIGVPAVLVLASVWGPIGGGAGELVAEVVVLGVQLVGIRRARGKARRAASISIEGGLA